MRTLTLQTKSALLASTLILPTQALSAQQDTASFSLEEIVVTAEKRTENLQDVAVSVQVLGNTQLENLNVNGFDDYVKFLPTVSYTQARPGQAQVYMRGIVSGSNGNHSASMPSVGVYLDEQPITTINEILDLHMYDIARVETLSGPQGTLFGASSQSGTLRIITNKPVIGEFSAGYDVALDTVKSGEMGYTLEGFVNAPISDNAAIRLVGWHEEDGGYIDNVASELTFPSSGITINNDDFAEKDFNDVTTTGGRALLKVDLNENWTISPGLIYQEQKSTGYFSHDPEDVGDLKVTSYTDNEYDEDWYQASLTIDGKIGNLDVVYAGAYLNRDRVSYYDYTGYSEYWESYLQYYYEDAGYCLYYNADGGCANPRQFVTGDEKFKRNSHELRIQSPQDNRLRWIVGAFYQKQEHNFDLRWTVPDADPAGTVVLEDPNTVVWQTRQVREDREKALFGQISFDLTDKLTLTGGLRLFKFNNTLYGFNGFLRHCTGFYVDGKFVEDPAGEPQYPCFDTRILDGQSKGSGETYKANLEYTINEDAMVYFTYSDGYRPGGVNRARVEGIPGYEPDWVENFEFGWKTQWMNNRLRFNGSIYHLNWTDVQFSFLDFSISNLTIIQNVGASETDGAEFDLDFAASENLTLSLSASYNDAKLKKDYFQDASDPDSLIAAAGTRMPFVPKLQFTATARYTEEIRGLPAFAQLSLTHTGGSWNDLDTNEYPQFAYNNGSFSPVTVNGRSWNDSYTLVNFSAGIDGEKWSLGLFVDNVFDKRAEIQRGDFVYTVFRSATDTVHQTNRPRSIGIRFGQKF
ncbi:TonB-dependent receptor [Kordiimonas sediminis]|uniref:TonB-dependent receptor n=1 Tax=Kordiimonas sediminis TaxID=1735581 RepID=A0A919E878_9PROT|nr:TonB-dependent receptor [Kordiimonas sediminis]GHF24109.1 TonB-dependent receptor [Kordiimonas sediminis]